MTARRIGKSRRGAFAHGLGVAGREVRIVGIGADLGKEAARTGAALALGEGRQHGDARHVGQTEGFGRRFTNHDLNGRGDADFGKVLALEGCQQVAIGDEDF